MRWYGKKYWAHLCPNPSRYGAQYPNFKSASRLRSGPRMRSSRRDLTSGALRGSHRRPKMLLSPSETTLRPRKQGTFRLWHFDHSGVPYVSQICVVDAFSATDAFLSTRSTSRSPLQVVLAIHADALSVRKYCAPLSETQDLRLWYFVHRWYFVHHVFRAFLRSAS